MSFLASFPLGSSGVFNRTNIPEADFTLRVVATDRDTGERAITRSRLWVHRSDAFCAVYLINRRIIVDENNVTVQFASSGSPRGFACNLNRGERFECKSSTGRYFFHSFPASFSLYRRQSTLTDRTDAWTTPPQDQTTWLWKKPASTYS